LARGSEIDMAYNKGGITLRAFGLVTLHVISLKNLYADPLKAIIYIYRGHYRSCF